MNMDNQERKTVEINPGDTRQPRTPEHAIGVDDIGLPEDIVPDDASAPQEIRPEPDKLKDQPSH
jgi:hypothetical protein